MGPKESMLFCTIWFISSGIQTSIYLTHLGFFFFPTSPAAVRRVYTATSPALQRCMKHNFRHLTKHDINFRKNQCLTKHYEMKVYGEWMYRSRFLDLGTSCR
jgi:hypothetical protein